MEKKKELILRSIIGIFGLILICAGIFISFSNISSIISSQTFQDLSLDFLYLTLTFILLGYILILIARFWSDFFKYITKTIISFALIFLVFGFFFISINSNSEEISNSIQPSIDYLIVGSIDSILDQSIEPYNDDIELKFAKNPQIKYIYYENLSQSDVDFISDLLDLTLDEEKKRIFAELFVVTAYEEIENNRPEFKGIPIPASELKTMAQSQFDFNLFNSLDSSTLKTLYVPNEDAFISLLVSDGEESKIVNPSNLKSDEATLIWDKLNLENNVSVQTKKEFLKLILSEITKQYHSYSNNMISIPLTMLGTLFPEEFKPLMSYDLFSNNLSLRANELNEIRDSCEIDEIKVDEICNFIETTKYDNMILLIQNESENLDDIPMNITPILESISTEEKVEILIQEKTSSGPLYFVIGVFLLIVSLVVYFMHFKLFNRDLLKIHVPYYVSKINLYHFIPTFIMVLIFYLLIKGDYIINFLASGLQDIGVDINLFTSLPIYNVMIEINKIFFLYSLYYLIFSIIIFVFFYFFLKEEVKKEEHNEI